MGIHSPGQAAQARAIKTNSAPLQGISSLMTQVETTRMKNSQKLNQTTSVSVRLL